MKANTLHGRRITLKGVMASQKLIPSVRTTSNERRKRQRAYIFLLYPYTVQPEMKNAVHVNENPFESCFSRRKPTKKEGKREKEERKYCRWTWIGHFLRSYFCRHISCSVINFEESKTYLTDTMIYNIHICIMHAIVCVEKRDFANSFQPKRAIDDTYLPFYHLLCCGRRPSA